MEGPGPRGFRPFFSFGGRVTENFDRVWQFVQKWEGGGKFTERPDDRGGPTKWGVSLASYPELGREGIAALTEEQAKEIFRRDYWDAVSGDTMPWPVDLLMADTAWLLGMDDVCAYMQAMKAQESRWTQTWHDFLLMRIRKHMAVARRNPSQAKFLAGWMNRCVDLYEEAYR